MGALSQVIPEKVQAASSGTMNLLNIGGIDPRSGAYYNYIETYAGGQGAMHNQDGMDAVQNHMTNTSQRASRGNRGRLPPAGRVLWADT